MTNLLLTADAAGAAAGGAPNTTAQGFTSLIMIVVMIAVFYFFMYRPQKKQERETNEMRNSLQVGDEITTIGGIVGSVIGIKEETLIIETGADRNKMQIKKWAVGSCDTVHDED
jgi:preprotein translocase subunit YajC